MKEVLETLYANESNQEKTKKGCSSCKNKKKGSQFIGLMIFSSYMFGTSIYGNYILIQKLINFLFD